MIKLLFQWNPSDTVGWPEERNSGLPQPIWVDHALTDQDPLPALHSHEEKSREANYSLMCYFEEIIQKLNLISSKSSYQFHI